MCTRVLCNTDGLAESAPPTIAYPAGVTGTAARPAIIEFAGGDPLIHHGRFFTIMTDLRRTADIACTAGLFRSKKGYAVAGQRQCSRPIPAAHTGRFAVQYRQTYGRSPHTTLHDE